MISCVLCVTWSASAGAEIDAYVWAGNSIIPYLLDDTTQKDTTQRDTTAKKTTRPSYIPSDRYGDPFSNKQSRSPLLFNEPPQNVKTKVELDTATNTYIIYEKLGDQDYRPVSTMTFDEYFKYRQRESMKSYMKSKSDGLDGESPLASRGLIPKIYISPMFDRIFGGNFVDIRPNGSVMLDFGGQWQRTANPALPIRQQSFGNFQFDQQISLNVIGKIGEKLKITINHDTKASFEFENNVRLEYTGFDNEIIQKIEAGNVSLPISSSLITGAQNLFGVKTQLKFGRLSVTSVASTQRSKTEKLPLKNGAQTRDVLIRADQYEANRHFFLSQFFRSNYEKALQNPAVKGTESGVNITRVEVYVTNRANNTQTLRNITGFLDMGERNPYRDTLFLKPGAPAPASNDANSLYNRLSNDPAARNANQTAQYLANNVRLRPGTDFEIIRGARKLTERDFAFHRQLGYLSLSTPLNNDEVLAVAYEYTYNGVNFKVGELSEDYQSRPDSSVIFLKLLKPATIQLKLPTWDLMMKNIYSLGGSQVSRDNFQLRIIYRDDSSGVDNPSLPKGKNLKNVPLTRVVNADRLNPVSELVPDGNWDYIEDVTIDSKNGRVIFPVLEPFGSHLRKQFVEGEEQLADKYVFNELYRGTQADALQAASKAKFFLVGRIQSSSSSDIMLPGINIAPGSVRVYAGSTLLSEGQDYTVNYDLGKVTILNQGILSSGQQVDIQYEKADLFNFQQRSFFGSRLDYTINKDINIGGTILYLNERPLIRRVSVGDEPTSNTLWGLDVNYRKDSRFLTKVVDFLPLIQTKEVSNITFTGEYAHLMPGTSSFVDPTNKGISYVDDFEGVRTPYDLTRQPTLWKPASTPIGFQPSASSSDQLRINDRRAKLAWYNIDNIFYRNLASLKPKNINDEDLKNHYVRAIGFQEVFPNKDAQAINLNEQSFDLAYYPTERGQYNYNTNLNPDGTLPNPKNNWGGVMRAIKTDTDFDNANIEYIEFWMMDPFIKGKYGTIEGNEDLNKRKGEIRFDLGTISEDVLKDDRMAFENGLSTPNQPSVESTTAFGKVTNQQPITNAFANTAGARTAQDIGLDGLNSGNERTFFNDKFINKIIGLNLKADSAIKADPSNDDFRHYLNNEYDENDVKILGRYKRYNNLENNSPEGTGNQLFVSSYTNQPDSEDLNADNTLNTTDAYYSYKLKINENDLQVGKNYIVDVQTPSNHPDVKWYLVRIPIKDLRHPNGVTKEGPINDFKSMRFMRMYLTGFEAPVVFRMVQFQLVASQWRKYPKDIKSPGIITPDEDKASLAISTVNIEENGKPGDNKVPYVVPAGVQRDRDVTSGVVRRMNEQSLSLCVDRLNDGDGRAAFKNVRFDFLNYKRLRMYIHAHTFDPNTKSNEVSAFVRIGTDFTDNYYEIEVPLTLTPLGATSNDAIWPTENEINVLFDDMLRAKVERSLDQNITNKLQPYTIYNVGGTKQNITVVGNPDLNSVVSAMIGIRNPANDKMEKSVCIWANELRVTDFIKNDGWATTGRLGLKLADLATITASGRYTTIGFGSIEQKISERARANTGLYNISSNITLDKFLPAKFGLRVPMYVSYERQIIEPQYDPLNPDVPLEASLSAIADPVRRAQYRNMIVDNTERRSINFTNVQKVKTGANPKSHIWDIENVSLTYAYSEMHQTNINRADYRNLNYKYALGYNFAPTSKPFEPLASIKFLDSPYLKLFKDFNISILPSNLSFRTDYDRNFTRTLLRSSNVFDTRLDTNLLTFEKSFIVGRNYGLQWSLFRSLNLNYTADVRGVIDEPRGDARAKIDNFQTLLGRKKTFDQNIRANYKLPLDKLPLTDWLSADVTYSAGFNWAASPLGIADTLGNTAQNNRERALNGRVDLLKLYNKVKFLNEINNPKPAPSKPKIIDKPKTVEKGKKDSLEAKRPADLRLMKGVLRALMTARSVNFSYSLNENTMLPGYMPGVDFLGLSDSAGSHNTMIPFLFGDQDPNIRFKAAERGWLGTSPTQNQPFVQAKTENITARTSLEPVRDFRLQLDAKRTATSGFREIFRMDSTYSGFESYNPVRTGSYSISYIAIGTAFGGNEDASNKSAAFRQFESNRRIVQDRLNGMNPIDTAAYKPNSQDVLIPSFIAAYTGQDVNKYINGRNGVSAFPQIPLPNWRIDYAGLTRIPFFSKLFSNLTLTHSYVSTYSVDNFNSSLQYGSDKIDPSSSPFRYHMPTISEKRDANTTADFVPVYVIGQVTMTEKFAPLIGVNIRTKSKLTFKLDYNRDRNMALTVSNAQVTELNSQDITFGTGFQKSGLTLPFRVQGRQVVLKNELTFRLDITIRDTRQIQRKLDEINVITQGMTDFQFKPTLNYVINQRLNIQGYFERNISTPKISTSFPRTVTRFGIQLRFMLS